MIQEKKGHKKNKRKPSAMAQVHNKVNAGVMDGVVYGGMMETARPERNKYKLGFEKGGLEPYGHVVNESSDVIPFLNIDLNDSDAYPFITFKKLDGSDTRTFVGAAGEQHNTMPAALLSNGGIKRSDFKSQWDIKRNEYKSGRIWFNKDRIVVSFYSYHRDDYSRMYNDILGCLIAIQDEMDVNFNPGEVMIDFWTFIRGHDDVFVPLRWLRDDNDVTIKYFPHMIQCLPVENGYYKLVTDDRQKHILDWKGDDIEEEQGYGVNENRKRLYITESQMRQIEVLLENEGTNMKRARKYLESEGYTDPKKRQQILDNIRTNIPSSRLQQCKFLLGVTRMYVDGELNSPNAIFELNKTLKYIASDAHVKEYDYNLNGETLQTLVNRFKSVAGDDLKQSIAKSNSKQLTVNNLYTIVSIDYPEEASKYGKYTSWCVTHSSDMYNKYTNDGTGRFYFCLREGFENELAVKGDNCPLDNYGLSMIAVSINLDGSVNTITCRWNHDNGGNDSIMNVDELENLLGRNFYQTFKPYTREELHAKGVILFDEVQGLLDSGERPQDIFERVDNFKNGFARVCLNRKWNFMNMEGKILSGQWFDAVHNFRDGFACVYLNGKWNLINTESKILSGQWFDEAYEFANGFARVCLNRKWNFMSTEGKILSGQWFDRVYDFKNGFAPVCLNDKWNLVNMKGKILSDQWFDYVLEPENGFVCVYLNDKWNFINMEGKILSDQWFDKVYDFNNKGSALVCLDGKLYKINTNGEISDINESKTKKTITITEESRVVNESAGRNRDDMGEKNIEVDYKKYIKSLIEFMREQHLRIDPLPEIELNPEEQDGIFVKTGYYSPDERKVVVFTDGRHPKDVLRTVAHEFIHHMQNLQNPDKDWGTGGDLEVDRKLRGIEGEAFLLGNIIFREWTEKMKKTKELNESRLAESPDAIHDNGFRLYWGDETSVPFMSFGLPGEERKFYIGKSDETHTDIIGKVMRELGEDPEEYGSCRTDFEDEDCLDMEMTGRYWGSANIISFWDTPRNNREKLEKTVSNLIYKGVDIRDGLLVDLWDEQAILKKNVASCLVPYKWFFNGAYQVFRGLGMTRSLPEGDGLFNVTFGNGAKKTVDKNGRFVENAYSLNESKKRKKQVKNDKGELVPETCDKCGGKVVCQIHGEPVYVCKDCGKYFGTMPFTLNEIASEIVEPDDVDLSSFNIKKHLNPKFWDDGHLDTRIRLKLLDIADDFFHFLGVDWVEPEDIIITGSLANYNWNKRYSDIDLHILIDYEDVDERVDFVREYFTMKKNEWNEKHKNLRIFGFPVEVYVQDANEPHASSGVYSVDRDKWLTEPDLDNLRSGKVDKRHVREMVSTYMNKIDDLVDIYKRHKDDEYEMRKVSEDAARMFDEIKKTRKDDLARYGREMCDGNIIFKALRRSDYIGKLIKLKNLTYDKINSL